VERCKKDVPRLEFAAKVTAVACAREKKAREGSRQLGVNFKVRAVLVLQGYTVTLMTGLNPQKGKLPPVTFPLAAHLYK
jgi:hypothetical protein